MKHLHVFYYMLFTFGLAPFAININKKRKIESFMKLVPTYSMTVLYTLCVGSLFWQTKGISEIAYTANWIQFIPNSFVYLLILINSERKRKLFQNIIASFHLLDEKLKIILGVSFTNTNMKIKRITIFATLMVMCCGSVIGLLHFYMGVDLARIDSLFYWISFCLPKVGLMLYNFFFAGCILLLSERVSLFTNGITSILNGMDPYRATKEIISNNDMKKINRVSTIANINIKNLDAKDTVESLYEIFETIQSLSDDINLYFGRQIIFTMLTAFICLCVQFFYIINHVRSSLRYENSEIYFLASCSLIFTHILEYTIILNQGHKIKRQWSILLKTLQRTKRKYFMDEGFKLKIDDLMKALQHFNISFHAAGLFPIDLTVVTSIISSITTYLVVLVQFKLSEDQNNKNFSITTTISEKQFTFP